MTISYQSHMSNAWAPVKAVYYIVHSFDGYSSIHSIYAEYTTVILVTRPLYYLILNEYMNTLNSFVAVDLDTHVAHVS